MCKYVDVAVQTQELLCAHVIWLEFDDFVSDSPRLHFHERQSPKCPPSLTNSPQPSFLLSNPSQHFKKPSSFSNSHSHCSRPDSELRKNDLYRCRPFAKLSLVSRRYGNVVEDYLDVYLRTPNLPKDDIARALVARGRARRGAGQRLLLMASRGQCLSLLHCSQDEFC